MASGSRSSNKMPGRRKRKKRRKKLPKGSSSSFLHGFRGGAGDLGITFEYAEEVNEEVAGCTGGVETAPCMTEMSKFIEEKVINQGEFIHRHGQPQLSLYSDRLHLYIEPFGRCWLPWMKNRHRYVRRWGYTSAWTGMLLAASDGQVCRKERSEQTLFTDKDGEEFDLASFLRPSSLRVSTWTSQRSSWTHPLNAQAWALEHR